MIRLLFTLTTIPEQPSSGLRPRTGNEDIHQSPGALLPIWAGRHVGHADKSPKQIERVEVLSDVATVDRTLYQRIDRSLDLCPRTFIQLGRTSHICIQCWGDDVLGSDVVYEQQHPGAQRFNRRQRLGELPFGGGQPFYFSAIDRFDQCIASRKVAIQRSRSNASLLGDVVQTGVCPGPGERFLGYCNDAVAIALCVVAGVGWARPTMPVEARPATPVPTSVLVELFTSEGCSSCPPADALLAQLVATPVLEGVRIVALGEHVDYRDDIGWKDPYSSHRFSLREPDNKHRFGLDEPHTPHYSMVMALERTRQWEYTWLRSLH